MVINKTIVIGISLSNGTCPYKFNASINHKSSRCYYAVYWFNHPECLTATKSQVVPFFNALLRNKITVHGVCMYVYHYPTLKQMSVCMLELLCEGQNEMQSFLGFFLDFGVVIVDALVTGTPRVIVDALVTGTPRVIVDALVTGTPRVIVDALVTGTPRVIVDALVTGTPRVIVDALVTGPPTVIVADLVTGPPTVIVADLVTGPPTVIVADLVTGTPRASLLRF